MSTETQVSTSVFSLVPKTMDEAFKLAEMMANSDFVPKAYQGKPGNVLVAVQMGQEVGLKPMAAVQNIAVINGKPGLYGDSGKAILLSNGCQIDEDDVEVIKKTGMGRCKISRPGHAPCERTFSIASAKTARLWGKDGPWTQYPERQMAWRAFWFAARDIASDLLKGLDGAEALVDMPVEHEINPRPARQNATQVAEAARPAIEHSPERDALVARLEDIARNVGVEAYTAEFKKIGKTGREMIGTAEHERLWAIANTPVNELPSDVNEETGEVIEHE